MKRSKRLAKGMDSIREQIEKHKAKRENAKSEGELELAQYYNKEIEALEKAMIKKARQLNR